MRTLAKRGNGDTLKTAVTKESDYADKIARACDLQEQIKRLNEEITQIKEFFLNEIEQSKCSTLYVTERGAVELKTTNSYACDPVYVPDLKKIFKENYAGFVNEKVSYGVSAALKKLLADGDYKHKDVVRNAVIIKTSSSVVFTPSKS